MRRIFFSLAFLILAVPAVHPQSVIITDIEDNRPLPDVSVYNRSKTNLVRSGNNGEADITGFIDDEIICFHLFSYETLCLSADEIKKADFRVSLVKKTFPIEDLVVSASRWEQNRNEVPNKISALPSSLIQFGEPQTAADLIASSGEVFVQKSQLGGGSPMIRGFATNRVLIVVDGVRMNNAIYREGNIQNVISLDPNITESAEIIFGPGAVVYGSDAIGGVMDFHTETPFLSSGDKADLRADALVRYSSADNEKTAHISFSAGGKRIAFLSGFTYTGYDDLTMGTKGDDGYLRMEYARNTGGRDTVISNPDPRVQVYSGYSQVNTTNKLKFKISRHADLVISNHYSALSDVPRYDRLIQYKSGMLRYGEWYYGPQVWVMNNLQFTLKKPTILFDDLRVTAAHQNYKESRHDRSFGDPDINEQFEKVRILSINIDAEKELAGKNRLIYYGVEYGFNDIISTAQTRDIYTGIIIPAGSRYPDGDNKYNCFSVYTGYRSNPSGTVTVNTGLRYNYVSLYSTIADNSFYNFPFTEISIANSALTGAAGVVWKPSEKMLLSANASTGFRAPNLDDAGKVFDSSPGVVVVPNPGLKPEYAYNLDLGISRDLGRMIRIGMTGFYTRLKNAMVRDDFLFNGEDSIMYEGEMSKVEAIVNKGYATAYGFSLDMRASFTRSLYLNLFLTLTEGNEQDGTPLRHSAPLFGSVHFVYESALLKADLYTLFNGSKKFEDMPPSEISKSYMYASDSNGNPWSPGWYTFNFKASLRFSKWGTVNAGVENILNARYRPYSSGIVSPGRNYILSLRVRV